MPARHTGHGLSRKEGALRWLCGVALSAILLSGVACGKEAANGNSPVDVSGDLGRQPVRTMRVARTADFALAEAGLSGGGQVRETVLEAKPPTPAPPASSRVEGNRFRITNYGESYNGSPLGCPGAGLYDSNSPGILAVGPANYSRWPCGTRLRLCSRNGCVDVVRNDSCPGCPADWLDTSEITYGWLCWPQTSGPCEVTVSE